MIGSPRSLSKLRTLPQCCPQIKGIPTLIVPVLAITVAVGPLPASTRDSTAIARTGAPPTRAEIAAELGFKSANAAEEHLQALARKGVIELLGGTSRGIRLKAQALKALRRLGEAIVECS